MHQAVMAALSTVNDPELHQDLVSLGMIERVVVEGNVAAVRVQLTTPACPLKGTIENDVRRAVLQVPGIDTVEVSFSAQVRAPQQPPLPGVKHVILVGSGKGGVGKSNVAVNVAAALAQDGARVGLLDADVYGPSVAHMLGQSETRITANEQRQMMPIEAHGLRFISMANLTRAGQALVWRGPMLHSAVQQFLKDAAWGSLDYLIIDLPPGTGDVQLSITQSVKVTGALIVTTPQDVALIDATRAVDMFRKASVPVLGVVENMSYFVAPDTGHTYDLFGRGGARKLGGLSVLGEVPLDPEVRQDADSGVPAVLAHPQSAAAGALREVARALAGQISVETLSDFSADNLEPLPVL
ncbi:ATPase-like, ParA/MinD [Deinococcus proteolyticus MRP]|uniref:Iron-sulfur cluster carrier protein n=1 Tax=Deinococcus proteolyticus (strain ATCC 35074 / DSM 20540 / JCM 6276 / NBRC 101906 / NCIMB 13154 / VKM Ac-1939 / CCM 2703 / MRP) TaxID=693977 RepID=F0RP32_DEIPM|nr:MULTISPECIES: Mrp/NBP35 family ATP-binding protein [Deinococcus]ADY25347.1 ATPase-like, ParA/MinD [Deinococcus proteolyticus MRP]MCY1701469.1 Mrp/NBP35 family ATP-binding protein [Deinococcus sp. SL84]